MGVRLDRKGMAEILRSTGVRREIDATAEMIAENVRKQNRKVESGEDLPVDVVSYTTDRAAAAVRINHPSGIGMQAKYGVLTKAAAEAGLEVTEK